MKMINPMKLIGLLAVSMLTLPQLSYAVGTVAGVNVTNTAGLDYTVGGGATISVNSNTTDFEVDQVVNFQLTEVGSDVHAAPLNSRLTTNVSRFLLSHDGNANQRFALAAANLVQGSTVTLGVPTFTDSQVSAPTEIDVNTFAIYADDGDGLFEPGADDGAPITFVELNQGVGTQTQTLWVWATLPASAADGENALISLTGTAQEVTTGNALTEDNDGDDITLVEIVFADAAGSDDVARDAIHSARDVYQAQAPALTVAKTITTIWDPVNAGLAVGGTNDPLAIPGAYVRYSITITNADSASAAATLEEVNDALDANLAFDPELIVTNCADVGVAAACASDSPGAAEGISVVTGTDSCTGGNVANARAASTTYYTSATADDDGEENAGTITVDLDSATGVLPNDGTHPNDGDLLPCETVTVQFNAIVQ